MFIGHFAVGFAARSVVPKASLGSCFFAAQLLDIVWPFLILLGVEHARIDPGNTAFTPIDFSDYPWSHSLAAALLWSAICAVVSFMVKKQARIAAVLGGTVFSHWILDLVAHRPDLPLYPGNVLKVGLGLWNSILGTLVMELMLFGIGVFLYVRATEPNDRIGTFAIWGLIGFLLVVYAMNVVSPPPPSITAVAWIGIAGWLLPLWGWWADRHRHSRHAFSALN